MFTEFQCSEYLRQPLEDLSLIAEWCAERLSGVQFDVVVVSGTSGLLVGPMVAARMGKRLAIVRKDGDSSHRQVGVEGWLGGRYVVLDDLISSGETMRRVVRDYERACAPRDCAATFVGAVLYVSACFRSADDLSDLIY